MLRMKILIISQHLFPIQTPRANRTTELIKELAKRGHELIIYAVLGDFDYSNFEKKYNIKIKKIPIYFEIEPYNSNGVKKRNLIDRILSKIFGELLQFPNIEFLFRIPNIIKNEKNIDLLITIADPHQIHWGTARAKIKYPNHFPKKWIADCGDPFMKGGESKHFQYYAKYEKRFCSNCDFISVPVKEAIGGYYPEFRDKIKIIPQGFLFDENITRSEPKNKILTFAYAGTFYKDIRNPSQFLTFLSKVDIEFKFIIYTLHQELILPFKSSLKTKIEIRNPIDRKDLIEDLANMDFLVNLENVNRPNQIPSKLIDYSITKRPILSINPTNIDTNLISEFLNKNYKNKFVIHNLNQYHISSVVDQFLDLAE